MSKFKGTKGKWTTITNSYYQEVNSNINGVNRMHVSIFLYGGFTEKNKSDDFSLSDESKANAILISKAPEMLEMLETLRDIFDKYEVNFQSEFFKYKEPLEQLIKEATEL